MGISFQTVLVFYLPSDSGEKVKDRQTEKQKDKEKEKQKPKLT